MEASEFDIRVVALKDRIFRLARLMLGDSAEAEDATQDIYEKLWRKRGDLERYDNVEAMIYVSARNHCHDKLRSRKSRERRAEKIAATTETFTDTSKQIELQDMKAQVALLIGALPPKQQSVMHLRDIEGCEIEEIAKLTQMDEPAVRVNLSRARKTVKEQLIKIMNHGV